MSKSQQSQQITGNNNIQVGGDLTINIQEATPKPTRVYFTPDYNVHISEANAKTLYDKIHEMANLIGDNSYHRILFARLKKHFNISTYRALPKEQFKDAIHYLDVIDHTEIQPKIRKNNNPEWRNGKYKAIHAKAHSLGWSSEELYKVINQYLDHKTTYLSITELSDTALKKVYEYLIRK